MQHYLSRMFGSVRLVQEVTRSNSNNAASHHSTDSSKASNVNIGFINETQQELQHKQSMYIHPQDIHELVYLVQNIKYISTPRQTSLFLNPPPFAVRHYPHKNKSQKLLCLWPLPVVTRTMILLCLIVSTLNSLRLIELSFSVPSRLIYQGDVKNLLLSPFLFHFTVPSLALFGWNVLILGLFEESLSHMMGSTRRFVGLLGSLFIFLLVIRNALGYVFSKSTGWAFPSLFFSDSIHEQSKGLSPFLFGLLVIQSLNLDDKYILIYDQENAAHHKITIHKVIVQLLMCLINFTEGRIYWWSISGLMTGFFLTLILQSQLAREKRQQAHEVKDLTEFIRIEHYRRTPLWRLLWQTAQRAFLVLTATWFLLKLGHDYLQQEAAWDLQAIPDPDLFTFVFMTAPRRGDPDYLTRTLTSYLDHWPRQGRLRAVVYTHFTHHPQFDLARQAFADHPNRHYLTWVREEGQDWNQRLHVSKALARATEAYQSTYYALMEDDFPICGHQAWQEVEKVIYKAETQVKNHCGVFVGTGGSGLFLKPEIARLTSQLLLKYNEIPPDIVIQKCLMGQLAECSTCQNTLVTSKTLLMYHIGYNTSTSDDRIYKKDEFQCGWRHPFNGDPNVITL